ncbi:hypothetical protein Hanom_Chr08g00697631 [Helianthus anomalus]
MSSPWITSVGLIVASIQIFYTRCILYFSLIIIYIDSYRRPRLVNMCKYNAISRLEQMHTFVICFVRGRKKKDDNKMIQGVGVESPSEEVLHQACRDRGLLGLCSVDEMREQDILK